VKLEVLTKQRQRAFEILRRHVREEDAPLSDHDFMKALARRYIKSRSDALIDPGE
jgi:hypothetical protein